MNEDKTYEVASADVVLPLTRAEATEIADALEMLAGIDEGEYTDTERLTYLAACVRGVITADTEEELPLPTLTEREHGQGGTFWIAEERPYFLARRDDGDELWLSRRPVAVNERIAKFPAGHEVTLFDIRAAIESPR